jgi:hypothetical protein
MNRKVSTVLDEALFRRAKLESARQGRPMSEIFGDALQQYLGPRRPLDGQSAVADSWGALPLDAPSLRRLLEEEDGWLDA